MNFSRFTKTSGGIESIDVSRLERAGYEIETGNVIEDDCYIESYDYEDEGYEDEVERTYTSDPVRIHAVTLEGVIVGYLQSEVVPDRYDPIYLEV